MNVCGLRRCTCLGDRRQQTQGRGSVLRGEIYSIMLRKPTSPTAEILYDDLHRPVSDPCSFGAARGEPFPFSHAVVIARVLLLVVFASLVSGLFFGSFYRLTGNRYISMSAEEI